MCLVALLIELCCPVVVNENNVIQNEELWLNHIYLQKTWEDTKRVEDANVQYLFHGTDKDTIYNEILTNDFNRNFNITHAYGKGVYFATRARYSLQSCYSQIDNDNAYGTRYQYLLYCRVIVGDYCKGRKDMITINFKIYNLIFMINFTILDKKLIVFEICCISDKKENKNVQCESMVDNIYDPKIFVTTVDRQAYPLALFKLKIRD